MHIIIEYQ